MPHRPSTRQVHGGHPSNWHRKSRAEADRVITFRIALQSEKTDAELEQIVDSVSNVASSAYGQYLTTQEQLQRHWQPHIDATNAMQALLHQYAPSGLSAEANGVGDYWYMTMDVRTAETLFNTTLFEFEHHKFQNRLRLVRPAKEYTIPSALAPHVLYIDGLESFPTEMQAQIMQRRNNNQRTNQDGDPFTIKQKSLPPSSSTTSTYRYNGPTPSLIRKQYTIPNNLYGTHDRNKLVIGTFLHEFYSERDLKQFIEAYAQEDRDSISLPSTQGECLVDKAPGITRATGEASLDVQVVAGLARSSNVEVLCYTQLRDQSRPFADDNQEPFLTFLQDINAMDPSPSVVSISYTDDECGIPRDYARAVNRELMKSAMKGISVLISAGDAGVQGSEIAQSFCNASSCSKFLAMFPASSPYVTSIGATTIVTNNGIQTTNKDGKFPEVVTTAKNGALITSGGGFSELFVRPAYQSTVVESYLSFANSSQLSSHFNTQGRAYPDLTAIGRDFPVFTNGALFPTDGTSVATPVVASMIVLLNKYLLDKGRPVLGFLNPLLYDLQTACPHVFSDITEGDTACGTPSMKCCSKGHTAIEGWDAASGLGTINFSVFLADLDECVAKITNSSDFQPAMTEEEKTALLAEMSRNTINLLEAQESRGVPQRQMMQVIFGAALLAGVVLVSLFIMFGRKRHGKKCQSGRFHRSTKEPASEYLLAREQ